MQYNRRKGSMQSSRILRVCKEELYFKYMEPLNYYTNLNTVPFFATNSLMHQLTMHLPPMDVATIVLPYLLPVPLEAERRARFETSRYIHRIDAARNELRDCHD